MLINYLCLPAVLMGEEKPYKNLYIYLISHPKNTSISAKKIFSRINFLNSMTRDVHFVLLGYTNQNYNNEEVVNDDREMPLTFDEEAFITRVQELEDTSNGIYKYSDDCELLFVNQNEDNSYDFQNMLLLKLDELETKAGIEPVQLLIAISQIFRSENGKVINASELVRQIIRKLSKEQSPIYKVFIAGSKKLIKERALLREQLSILENQLNINIRSYTYEDFNSSLTGKDQGRQNDYNEFIRTEANVVIFVFETKVGQITEEEFNIAYETLKKERHPDMYVYVRKKWWNFNKGLKSIKKLIFNLNQEYYIEYKNLDELRHLFYKDLNSYLQKRILINPK